MVISLSGYIVYDKFLNKNENQENNSETSNKSEENNSEIENNISWVDYLLEQEFVSATLSVCSIDDKYVYNKDADDQPNPGAYRDITAEELKKILNTISESETGTQPYGEIVKSYGYAAPACEDKLGYRYIHKGKEYIFELAAETIIITEDQDFIDILNKHMDEYSNYALNKNNTNYDNLVKDMMKDYVRY